MRMSTRCYVVGSVAGRTASPPHTRAATGPRRRRCGKVLPCAHVDEQRDHLVTPASTSGCHGRQPVLGHRCRSARSAGASWPSTCDRGLERLRPAAGRARTLFRTEQSATSADTLAADPFLGTCEGATACSGSEHRSLWQRSAVCGVTLACGGRVVVQPRSSRRALACCVQRLTRVVSRYARKAGSRLIPHKFMRAPSDRALTLKRLCRPRAARA